MLLFQRRQFAFKRARLADQVKCEIRVAENCAVCCGPQREADSPRPKDKPTAGLPLRRLARSLRSLAALDRTG